MSIANHISLSDKVARLEKENENLKAINKVSSLMLIELRALNKHKESRIFALKQTIERIKNKLEDEL